MRSPASWLVSSGRVIPSCFIRSVMRGRWFQRAAATSKKECGRVLLARSGPTLPPTPLIEWHFSQPLAENTREPAIGSWLGLNTGCAHAPSKATSAAAIAKAPITTRIIVDPFCRHPTTPPHIFFRPPPMLRESLPDHKNYSNLSLSTRGNMRGGSVHCRTRLPRRRTPCLGSVNCPSHSLPMLRLPNLMAWRLPLLSFKGGALDLVMNVPQQHRGNEGFCEKRRGARGARSIPGGPRCERRDDDDGDLGGARARGPDDVEPVAVGQAKVRDHEGRRRRFDGLEPFDLRAGRHHPVA